MSKGTQTAKLRVNRLALHQAIAEEIGEYGKVDTFWAVAQISDLHIRILTRNPDQLRLSKAATLAGILRQIKMNCREYNEVVSITTSPDRIDITLKYPTS